MGVQPSPASAWEDVGPWHGGHKYLKNRRRSQPLHCPPGEIASNGKNASVAAGAELRGSNEDIGYVVSATRSSPVEPLECPQGKEVRGDDEAYRPFEEGGAADGGGCAASMSACQRDEPVGEVVRGEGEEEEGGDVVGGDGGTVVVLDSDQIQDTGKVSVQLEENGATGYIGAVDSRGTSAGRRRAGVGGGGTDIDRVRGFHDMICVGFVVSLCLNLGSLTARQKGYFAAEVKCLSPGAAETVLQDLGVWVGWRRAVANADEATGFDLEDLSMVGAAMGILTVVGHATDCLVNAAGLYVLLSTRRKPLEMVQSRIVKRLCLASLAMAGWLLGMTVIGFLVAVKGPIGSAAVDFYARRFDLSCNSSVAVSVDYAYAMTTLTILCQFFVGIVALPKPSCWISPCCRAKKNASSSCATPSLSARGASRGRRGRFSRPRERGLGEGMVQNTNCDPV